MKNIFIVLIFFALTMTSCKKTKLTGDNSGLTGSWTWIGGWSDGGNTNFKLDLTEKGKYKLFNGKEKIDHGRLISENNKLKFESDKLFNKGTFAGGKYKIIYYKNDTLSIGSVVWTDFPSSTYVKNK